MRSDHEQWVKERRVSSKVNTIVIVSTCNNGFESDGSRETNDTASAGLGGAMTVFE